MGVDESGGEPVEIEIDITLHQTKGYVITAMRACVQLGVGTLTIRYTSSTDPNEHPWIKWSENKPKWWEILVRSSIREWIHAQR